MGENDEVKLHGTWASPFSFRVVWALKLKGIPYEYIEEDIVNKGDTLLRFNPVYKKIPILVHNGKPICESMVILEYIEENWPHRYSLLPTDPYQRALARFWIKFFEEKSPSMWKIYRTKGEEQERAIKDMTEMFQTIEKECFGNDGKKFLGGDRINIVDIAFGGLAHWFGVIEELGGVKVLEADKFPRLHAWTERFKEVSVVSENLPDRDEFFGFLERRKKKLLGSN